MFKGLPVYSHSVQIVENFSGIIIVIKGQGAPLDDRKKVLVEATEGCNFNRGKSADRGKSTKFKKQILSTCTTTVEIFKN
jgi:hypothetical protein